MSYERATITTPQYISSHSPLVRTTVNSVGSAGSGALARPTEDQSSRAPLVLIGLEPALHYKQYEESIYFEYAV